MPNDAYKDELVNYLMTGDVIPGKEIAVITKTKIESTEVAEQAKQNILDALDQGREVLNSISNLATRTQQARMFEVYASMFNTYVNANKALIAPEKKEDPANTPPGNKYIQEDHSKTIVFNGSTKDLMKHIRDENEE